MVTLVLQGMWFEIFCLKISKIAYSITLKGMLQDQTSLSGAQLWEKGQQARTLSQEVPPKREEKLLYWESDRAVIQTVESLSLEIFKTYLDTIMCKLEGRWTRWSPDNQTIL